MKTSLCGLSCVVSLTLSVGMASAAPNVNTNNAGILCDVINWLPCWGVYVDGDRVGTTYMPFAAAISAGGSITTAELSDLDISPFPLTLEVGANAFGINPGNAMVMSPVGAYSATMSGLTVSYMSPGQMPLNELGEFDPQDFLITVTGGTMTYELAGGNGAGVHDFSMNPVALRVPAGQNFGTWNSAEQRIFLQANAASETFPIGNTDVMLTMQFTLDQVVPAPGSAMILLASSFGLARRRR